MEADISLLQAIHSARALRRFRPDPVSDEVLTQILDAAIQAPSAGNGQNWLFIVVRTPEQRQKLGDIYRRAGAMVASFYQRVGRPEHMTEQEYLRFANSGLYLHQHMADAPVLVVACLRMDDSMAHLQELPRDTQLAMMNSLPWMAGASIYPAVQNLILACRAFGLGTCLTTNHMLFEDEVRRVLGLPADYRTFALLPVGYPINKFGSVRRRPLSDVVAQERFGEEAAFLKE